MRTFFLADRPALSPSSPPPRYPLALASGEVASDLSCADWSSSMERDSSRHGRATLVDAEWSDVDQVPCNASQHLYCVQDGPSR